MGASKNNILPSEKQDGGKVPANATANDSQAVVNYNRQQRHNQNNNTNNQPYSKSDKSEQPYINQKPAYKFDRNSSNQNQTRPGKYSQSGPSKPPQQISGGGNRLSTPRKPSPISSTSVSPEPIPPPPVN